MSVQTEVVTITPETASRILERNENNRAVREQVVTRYARDMQTGNWKLNGEAIKFAADGTLMDGQHRLYGCLLADTPFETFVIRGFEFDIRATMDTGARRSLGDVLRWQGEKNVAALAAATETGLCWDSYGTPASRGTAHSHTERLAWLEANPDVREAVKTWNGIHGVPLRLPYGSGVPFLLRATRISSEDAANFVHLLKTGANIGEKHPIAKLRSWAMRTASSKGRYGREDYMAVEVKAWNAYVTGREIGNLSWRSGGVKPEDFPVMIGPDGRSYDEIWTEAQNPTTNPAPEVPDTVGDLQVWLENA